MKVREDVSSILKLMKIEKPSKIELFVASEWKRKLRQIASDERKFDAAMKTAMADPEIKPNAAAAAKVLASYMKNAGSLGQTQPAVFELEALKSAIKLLEGEFGAAIAFCMEEETGVPKAKNALPGKPSILVS